MRAWLAAQKDVLETLQTALTIAAIIVGGWWTYTLFIEHRESLPHLNIRHSVTSKMVLPNITWIHLTVNIENTGDSLASLHSADVRLQQILPLDPSFQKRLADGQELVPHDERQVPWPLLRRSLTRLDLEIEPKESTSIEFDFVFPDTVKTVRVYSYFENAKESSRKRHIGWSCGTILDITGATAVGKDSSANGSGVR